MGAIGAFGTSLGGGRMMLYALGRYWIEVPKVVLVRLEGRLRPGVFGRDVALHVNGALGQQGALGMGLEFAGSYIADASMDMRFTLCNMGTEMGAVASYTNWSKTVNGTTTEGIPYYVSPTQLAVIIPSTTPTGTGTMTVTYNNQTSAAFPITIVQSAFGILTMNGTGFGQAAVLDTNFA